MEALLFVVGFLILSLIGCWIIAARRSPVSGFLGVIAFFVVGAIYAGNVMGGPVQPLVWLVLAVAITTCVIGNIPVRRFLAIAGVVGVGMLSAAGIFTVVNQRTIDRLRAEYPLVDLQPRLGEMRSLPTALSTAVNANKPQPSPPNSIESNIASLNSGQSWQSIQRRGALERLHDRTLNAFVDAPQFGVGRMMIPRFPSKRSIEEPIKKPAAKQPREEPPPAWATEMPGPTANVHADEVAARLTSASIADSFVDPGMNGYVQSGDRVAGFLPHRLEEVNSETDLAGWSIARVYLVGLVIHKEPTVYLTDSLPDMATAKTAPQRPLDPFEREGLDTLIAGGGRHIRGNDHLVRMLAAIHSKSDCTTCHGGKSGDLLGAFSYFIVKP